MNPQTVEVWFWKRHPLSANHWWIGLVSPMYTHVAIVVGGWKLNGSPEGSQWLPLDCYDEDSYYNQPSAVISLPSTYLVGPVDFADLENHKSKPLPLWCHHVARDLWGFDLQNQPRWNCVDLTKRVLGWERPDIQTPDELFKELTHE